MKELSKAGVTGVNLFGQVDDVDAKGYLAAVDFDDFEEHGNPVAAKRVRARRNVVTVVLIHGNVMLRKIFSGADGFFSLPIQKCCFRCFRGLLDDILLFTFYVCMRSMRKTCRPLLSLLFWHTDEVH